MKRTNIIYQVIQKLESESDRLYIPRVSREDGTSLAALAFSVCTRLESPVIDAGAGVGYSAAWLALGVLGAGGHCRVVAIEWDEDNYRRLEENARLIAESGVEVEPRHGDALKILEEFEEASLVFVDIEKHQYPEALEKGLQIVGPGGLLVFHNALFPPPPEELYTRIRERGLRHAIIPTIAGGLLLVSPR